MDRNAFDTLVRGFGSRQSRRSALMGLAAGLFGLGAAKGAAAQVGIAARTCGQFCRRDADCNFGLRCGAASEECFAIPSSKTRCTGNSDCPRRYETCNANERCINTLAGPDCPECRRNADCPGDARCRDNGTCR